MAVMDADNPYKSPDAVSPPQRGYLRAILPSRTWTCILLSLVLWPTVAFTTDLLGIWIEPALNINDFGLAALNFTLPMISVTAIILWFRAFLLSRERSKSLSVAIAVCTLPLWFVATAITTCCFFPFGRISDAF